MSIIIMILLLSVLILVHEAGHYLAAKMFGMKVAKFGFGLPIGPTLYETQLGETKILVHAFLLGGYVAFPDDEPETELPKDSPDRFLNRPVYQRLVVVSAGVIANIITAFVLVLMVAFLWGQIPSGKYDIFIKDIVAPKEEAIWQSGMEKGDQILTINGSKATSPYVIMTYAQKSVKNDGKIDFETSRVNYEKLKKINPAFKDDEIIPADIVVKLPEKTAENRVRLNDNVLKGMEKFTDKQVTLNDKQKQLRDETEGKSYLISDGTYSLNDLSFAITDGVRPIYLTVKRDGEIVELNPIYPNKEGVMGIQMEIKEITTPTKNFKSAVVTSGKYLWDQTSMLMYGLYQIVTGKIPLKDLHGIIAITKVGGDIIDNNGIFSGLLLTAIISLDLAIINFLPIPALDGGHVMFLLIEKLRGRPLDEKTVDKIGSAFFMALIVLMVLVLFNDIYALIAHQI